MQHDDAVSSTRRKPPPRPVVMGILRRTADATNAARSPVAPPPPPVAEVPHASAPKWSLRSRLLDAFNDRDDANGGGGATSGTAETASPRPFHRGGIDGSTFAERLRGGVDRGAAGTHPVEPRRVEKESSARGGSIPRGDPAAGGGIMPRGDPAATRSMPSRGNTTTTAVASVPPLSTHLAPALREPLSYASLLQPRSANRQGGDDEHTTRLAATTETGEDGSFDIVALARKEAKATRRRQREAEAERIMALPPRERDQLKSLLRGMKADAAAAAKAAQAAPSGSVVTVTTSLSLSQSSSTVAAGGAATPAAAGVTTRAAAPSTRAFAWGIQPPPPAVVAPDGTTTEAAAPSSGKPTLPPGTTAADSAAAGALSQREKPSVVSLADFVDQKLKLGGGRVIPPRSSHHSNAQRTTRSQGDAGAPNGNQPHPHQRGGGAVPNPTGAPGAGMPPAPTALSPDERRKQQFVSRLTHVIHGKVREGLRRSHVSTMKRKILIARQRKQEEVRAALLAMETLCSTLIRENAAVATTIVTGSLEGGQVVDDAAEAAAAAAAVGVPPAHPDAKEDSTAEEVDVSTASYRPLHGQPPPLARSASSSCSSASSSSSDESSASALSSSSSSTSSTRKGQNVNRSAVVSESVEKEKKQEGNIMVAETDWRASFLRASKLSARRMLKIVSAAQEREKLQKDVSRLHAQLLQVSRTSASTVPPQPSGSRALEAAQPNKISTTEASAASAAAKLERVLAVREELKAAIRKLHKRSLTTEQRLARLFQATPGWQDPAAAMQGRIAKVEALLRNASNAAGKVGSQRRAVSAAATSLRHHALSAEAERQKTGRAPPARRSATAAAAAPSFGVSDGDKGGRNMKGGATSRRLAKGSNAKVENDLRALFDVQEWSDSDAMVVRQLARGAAVAASQPPPDASTAGGKRGGGGAQKRRGGRKGAARSISPTTRIRLRLEAQQTHNSGSDNHEGPPHSEEAPPDDASPATTNRPSRGMTADRGHLERGAKTQAARGRGGDDSSHERARGGGGRRGGGQRGTAAVDHHQDANDNPTATRAPLPANEATGAPAPAEDEEAVAEEQKQCEATAELILSVLRGHSSTWIFPTIASYGQDGVHPLAVDIEQRRGFTTGIAPKGHHRSHPAASDVGETKQKTNSAPPVIDTNGPAPSFRVDSAAAGAEGGAAAGAAPGAGAAAPPPPPSSSSFPVRSTPPPPRHPHHHYIRDYVTNVLTRALDATTRQLIEKIRASQKRLKETQPLMLKKRLRYVLGLREVLKGFHVDARRVRLVVIAPDVECVASEGALDDTVQGIIAKCRTNSVPFYFAMSRVALGAAFHQPHNRIAAFAVFNAEGAYDECRAAVTAASLAKKAYLELTDMKRSREDEILDHATTGGMQAGGGGEDGGSGDRHDEAMIAANEP